jgi:predicted nuclease of predicted toxin-antitoxin system
LAARLVEALADVYPQSLHVGGIGLAPAPDRAIWAHAQNHDLVIVSKDEDFHRLSVLHGPPPKVIWIRLGTCSTDAVIRLLRTRRVEIEGFVAHGEAAFLALA